MANQIKYQVGFDVHKQDLNQLKASLQQLSKMKFSDLMKINSSDKQAAIEDLKQIKSEAANIEKALKEAFNVKLNTINIQSFNKSLKDSDSSIEKIYQTFKKAGTTGENAFRNLSSQVLSTNVQLKQAHTLLDNMATTLANTIKWNVASSAINSLSGSVQQAFGYVKALDTSLNDIRIVTNKTAEDMDVFAEKANEVAQSLGKTTVDYTNAALIYAQQGLSDKEIEERAAITLKTANVTGQSTDAVSEELTAVWNGYKVNAEEAELYVDRLAAVAATTASDLEELSTGMSKVASAAATMGVNEEQLAAQLSTIISVTREAPETIGTSLKTIYARISDIKAGIAEDGADLGYYSGKMAEFGVNVLDANGNLRDMGAVMEEIGGKWDTLTREQQIYLTQTMAGQRQYSRLLALFDNWDQYTKALNTAQNAAGTLQKQQDIYMESTAAHLNTLKASVENIYDSFVNTDSINGLVDALSSVANITASFVDSIGGGGQILKDLGAIGVTVFSNQIAKGINTTITNFETAKNNARQFEQALETTQAWQGIPELDEVTKDLLSSREQMLKLAKFMSPEQFSGVQTLLSEITQVGNELAKLSEKRSFLDAAIKQVTNYKDGWEDLNDVLKDQEAQQKIIKRLKQQENQFKDLQVEIQKYGKTLSGLGDSALKGKDIADDLQNAKEKVQQYINSLKDLAAEGKLEKHQQQIENLQKELSELDDSIPDEQIAIKLNRINKELQGIASNTSKSINETRVALDHEFAQTAKSIGGQIDSLTQKVKNLKGSFTTSIEEITRTVDIEKIAKFAGGITQVGSAISQVQNVGSIFANNDLDTVEKFTQSMSNLVPTVGMAAYGIKSLGEALGFALGPFGIIAGLITAAGAALSIYNGYLKQNQQERIERNKAIIQEQNQRQAEIESHKELYKSLQELDDQYKNGQISRIDLKSSVEDLIEQYGLEGKAADNLRNSYLDLASAIEQAQEQQAKKLVKSTEREKKRAGRNLKEAINEDGVFKNRDIEDGRYNFSSTSNESERIRKQLQKVGGKQVFDSNFLVQFVSFQIDPNSEESIVEFYEKIQKAVDKIEELNEAGKISDKELEQSNYYKQMTGILDQLSEEYDIYKNALKDAKAAQEEQDVLKAIESTQTDLQNIQNVNEYLKERMSLIDELKNKGYKEEDASKAVDKYLKENFNDLYNQYSEISNYIDQLKDHLGNTEKNIDDLINQLNDQQLTALMGISPEDLDSWDQWQFILDKIANTDFSNFKDLDVDINTLQENASNNYAFLQSLEDQVKSGKGVSNSTFKQLGEMLPEEDVEKIREYFDMMSNGTYKMTEDAEEFYSLIDGFKLEGFYEALGAIQTKMQQVNQISQALNENNFNYQKIDQSAFGAGAVGFDFNYDVLKQQLEYLEAINGATEEEIANWQYLTEQQTISVSQCEDIANAVHKGIEQTGDLTQQNQQLKQQWEEIQMQIHDALVPLDQDIDTTQLERLTELYMQTADQIEGLSDGLKDNRDWAEDAAAAILRYDDAIQNLIDNYDEWISVLKQGSQVEYVQIAEDLADAYQDLLDLVGDDALSDEFLRNAENLELFRIAAGESADGTEMAAEEIEAAYNRLRDLALQDIVAHLVIEDESFYSDLQTIQDQIASWKAQGLSDIEVNARLQTKEFINSLNTMLQKTDAGVAQAENLVQGLGFDATVIQSEPQVKTTDTENQYWVPASYHTEYLPAGGEQHQGAFAYTKIDQPGHWESVPGETTSVIPGTGAVEIKSIHQTTGGGIKFQQASNGGGSTGSSRRATKRQTIADDAAKEAEKQQKEIDAANKKAQQEAQRLAKQQKRAQEKAQREAQAAQKKAQQQAEKAQREWEKENSDTSQKDEKESIKDERDLYHDINIEINKVDRELERIQKRQERMYGKDLLNNLNKQTQILERHKEKLKEKQDIQEYDLQQQQQELRNLGVMFDAYGNIINYMDILAQKQSIVNSLTNQYNSLVAQYNASTNKTFKEGLSQQMEAVNKQIEAANKNLKDTESSIKNYDSLRDAMQDLIDQVEEETQKQIEINISKFRMELEIRLDLGEAERDWNEFQRKVINHTDIIKDSDFSKIVKDAETSLQNMDSYFGINGQRGQLEALTNQLLATQNQIRSIDSMGESAIYGDNKAQAMEDLQNDLDKLMGSLEEIQDLVDAVDQAYLDTVDDAQNHFEKQLDDYEYVADLIQHDMDLLTLLYGDKQYDAMSKYYESLRQNQMQELDFARQQAEFWKKRWDEAEGEQDAKIFEENYRNAVTKVRDLVAQSAKTIREEFINSIEGIFDELDKKLSNGKGMDYLSLEWDLINKNADEYLDTINAAFAVQELEGKFRKAINNADITNIKAQKQLKTLMDEQLANLRAKEKLTQYDVDRAEKLLEIEQARIALEDARSNKTSMQLRRDSQGNYSYEYVADQDSIIEAQQNLAAAQNDLYNFDKDRYQSNLDDMLSAWQDFQSKYKQIITDASLTEQQRIQKTALLREQYGEFINDKTVENLTIRSNLMESAFADIAAIYDTDVANYNNMSEREKQILMEDLVPTWDSGVQQMADKVAGDGGFIPTCQKAFDDITEATKKYEEQLHQMAETAGFDLNEVKQGVDHVSDSFKELIVDNEELIEVMDAEINYVNDLRDAAHALVSEYNSVYSAAMSAVSGIQSFIRAQQQQAAAEAAQYGPSGGSASSWSSNNNDISYDSGSDYVEYYSDGSDFGGDGDPQVGDIVTFTGQYYHDSFGQDPNGSYFSGVEGGVEIDAKSSTKYGGIVPDARTGDYDVHIRSANWQQDGYGDLGWIKLSQLRGYATGGYTGDWSGDEGKIGILHQKELVLNEKDTQNLLDSVTILRSIMGNVTTSIATRLNDIHSNIFNSDQDSDSLEQNVHIEASFPNVNSKREIEEALNDLVNLAAQRAMKR